MPPTSAISPTSSAVLRFPGDPARAVVSGSLDEIRNYVLLRENLATSGQPRAHQFALIAGSGFGTVINLATPDHPDAVAGEGDIVAALGMDYVHLPVPFDAPRPAHVRRFCRVLHGLADGKVWVHCIMNYRVSAFAFHYLRDVVGLDEQACRSPLFARWQPDETWAGVMAWRAADTGLGGGDG